MISQIGDPNLPQWEWGVRQSGNMNKQEMYLNIKDITSLLNKYNIPYILCFGTLLGIYRDNDLILWDNDSDLLIDQKYKSVFNEKIIPELTNQMFFSVPFIQPEKDTHAIRHGEKVEIWWFEEIDGNMVYDQKIQYSNNIIGTPKKIIWEDLELFIPEKPEEFLKLTYGPNWSTPIKGKKGF